MKTLQELIELTDKAIAELVYPKVTLLKAYNYYNGIMDPELYKYLEENYGIGSPTSVEFIPLVKKHIDALIGEYLGSPILPKITCKDRKTIDNMAREKQLYLNSSVAKFLQSKVHNSILNFLDLKNPTDPNIELQLKDLIDDIDLSFISEYEIAAQNVVQYLMLSRTIDIQTKLKLLILDLLVTGYCFYEDKPSPANTNVTINVYSPLNVFPDRNPNSPYVKDSYRIVVRKWLTSEEILKEYGNKLKKEDLEKVKEDWEDSIKDDSYFYIKSDTVSCKEVNGITAGQNVIPGFPVESLFYNKQRLTPVYEVQWLETDDNFIMLRYSTVRIGQGIYILDGKDENVIRSKDDPNTCSLTVNGVYFLNRSYQPYSLMLACISLQDKYNLLHYYRDNLIASSGTVGDWIDESLIPTNLGVNWPERVKMWLAYKKQGLGLIDTAQESRVASGQAPINTIFNGFDNTIKVQSILAIQLAIDSIEQTCSSITGVFRERLNGIEQHDAVSNVKMGALNSYIITKQYFQLMDLVTEEMLLDALNIAKIVYSKGLTGSILLGNKRQKLFTALPKYFTLTDYDIHVLTSTTITLEMMQLQLILPDLIKSGMFTPDMILDALTTKSLTELKHTTLLAMRKLKEETSQIQQLSLLNQDLQLQLQQMQLELLKAQLLVQKYEQLQMQLEVQKLQSTNKVEWFKAQTDRTYKEDQIEVDKAKVKIEEAQLYDGNPYNDKIKFE